MHKKHVFEQNWKHVGQPFGVPENALKQRFWGLLCVWGMPEVLTLVLQSCLAVWVFFFKYCGGEKNDVDDSEVFAWQHQ